MILFAGKSLVLRSLFFSMFYMLTLLISPILLSPAFADEPNSARGKQWTNGELLSFFAYSGDDEFRIFLDKATKEDVNQPVVLAYGQGERSLLSLIIELKDNKTFISRLLEKGANPEGVANSNTPPLMAAIEKKQWEIARLLLEAGANPSRVISGRYFDEKITLLYEALKDDEFNPFIEMAIAFKPELVVTDSMKEKKGYLELALENNLSVEVIRYFLMQHKDLNKKINQYGTPYEFFLFRIATHRQDRNDKEMIARQQALLNFFLDQGVKEVSPSSKGRIDCYDPLYVVRSNLKLLNRLLEKGFDPNKSNCYQQTHLTIAAELGYLPVFKALLTAGGELKKDTINEMIKSTYSNGIIHWVWQNKPDIFKQCQMSDCEEYIENLLANNKTSDDFSPIVETLLTRLSGKTKPLNQLLKIAISKNNTHFADRLIAAGANPLDSACDCQQAFWQHNINEASIAWLVDHQVSPFVGDRSFHEAVSLNTIPAKQLKALLKTAPEAELSQKNLHHWFTLLLDSLTDSRTEYGRLQQQLAVFATYNITVNNVVDDKGALYLPRLINELIGKQNNDYQDMALIWLLGQGAKPIAENQSHYLANPYLRALMDRAGKESATLAMQPQDEVQAVALQKLIDSGSPTMINALITAGLLPENKTMGLKTKTALEAAGISDMLYACHYASHQAIWTWLQKELDGQDEAAKTLFQACTATDLTLAERVQAPPATERKQWFKNNFRAVNFHVLELDSASGTTELANNSVKQDNVNTLEKNQTLSTEESIKLQTLLTAQLKNVTKMSLNETLQTVTTMIQAGIALPDKALQIFVYGTDLIEDDLATFITMTKKLIAAGADPTTSLFDEEGYSLMEYLPLNEAGQAFYNDLYNDLSLIQKIRLWNAFPTRFIARIASKEDRNKNRLILLFCMALFLFAELAAFIALIVYFWKIDKHSVAKQIIPTWRLQSVFWAGVVLLAFAIVNALGSDFFAYQLHEMIIQKDPRLDDENFRLEREFFQWSIWMTAWSLVVMIQMIALIILFKRTFVQKIYYSISFFTGFLFFTLTLSLPLLLVVIAENHEHMVFPFYPLF